MSNRNTEWSPWLQQIRDDNSLASACAMLLKLYDAGERIPPSAWEILRERLAKAVGRKP